MIVFLDTGMSALALLYVIGAYAIVLGSSRSPVPSIGRSTAGRLLVLTGLVSILFGVVMFAEPGSGALVLLALIAAFALVAGVSELVVAIGGKRLLESSIRRGFTPKPQPSSM